MDYRKLQAIVAQYTAIVARVERTGVGTVYKTRVYIKDGSYIDFWFSPEGRYS